MTALTLQTPTLNDHRFDRRSWIAATASLCFAFALLVWPVVFSGAQGTSEAFDQRVSHMVVVRSMAEQWPNVDLVDYDSATTPGYHLLMAAASSWISDSDVALQFISSFFSLGLLLVVFRCAAREIGPGRGAALVLPLLGSNYFLGGSIWLTTDNAGKFFAVLALSGSAMLVPTTSKVIRWGFYAVLAVMVRQILLWVAAPVALAAVLLSPLGKRMPAFLRDGDPIDHCWYKFFIALPGVIAPFIVVAAFFHLWGGLVPPGYISQHAAGSNPAVIPLALSLTGLFGIFFLPAFGRLDLKRIAGDWLTWVAVIIAVVLSIVFETAFDREAGRWGGPLWLFVARMPEFAGRTIVFPPLAALGALVLVIAWRRACAVGRGRAATILLVSVFGWLAAQIVNSQAWQRYCEPIVIIELIWLAALAASPHDDDERQSPGLWWIGPVILGLIQFALSGYALYQGVYLDLAAG